MEKMLLTTRYLRVRRIMLATASALSLAACAPPLGAMPSLVSPSQLESSRSFDAPRAAWPSDAWWEAYGDAQLNALIEEGLAHSPSLAAAAARVAQAQASLQQSGALNGPTINAEGSAQSARQSLNATGLPSALTSALPRGWNDQGRVALQLNYQLDFFGRNRAAFAAAMSGVDAAQAEAAATRLQLSSAIALAYADLQRQAADHAAAEEIVRLREQSLALVRQRFDAQLENQGQLAQAQSELAAARGDLIAIEGDMVRTGHAIAALMGRGPDRALDLSFAPRALRTPHGAPESLAAQLIGRRPDIVAARARAEAAARRIDMARADFYPNINLTALIGLHSIGLDTFAQGDSRFGQVGPAISLPIFSAGRLEGAYRGARAEYDEAVALYNQTLVDALKEVADALSDRRALDLRLAETRAALAAGEESYRVARLRYEGGLASYIDVLTVENRLVAQRRALAVLETQTFALDVALVRALGGGFSTSS